MRIRVRPDQTIWLEGTYCTARALFECEGHCICQRVTLGQCNRHTLALCVAARPCRCPGQPDHARVYTPSLAKERGCETTLSSRGYGAFGTTGVSSQPRFT